MAIRITYTPPGGVPPLVFSTTEDDAGACRLLNKYEGFGSPTAEYQTARYPGWYGTAITSTVLAPRDIVLEVLVVGDTFDAMMRTVEALIRATNPLSGDGTLVYQRDGGLEYTIFVRPNPPIFDTTSAGRSPNHQKLTLVFVAHNPAFRCGRRQQCQIRPYTAPTFPLFPAGVDRLKLQTARPGATIVYGGDIPAPVTITCAGPCSNIRISNARDNGTIWYTGTVACTDRLVITTGPGLQSARLDSLTTGVSRNATPGIVPASKFWQLHPGANPISIRGQIDPEATVDVVWDTLVSGAI
jgi:hypothetical protein